VGAETKRQRGADTAAHAGGEMFWDCPSRDYLTIAREARVGRVLSDPAHQWACAGLRALKRSLLISASRHTDAPILKDRPKNADARGVQKSGGPRTRDSASDGGA